MPLPYALASNDLEHGPFNKVCGPLQIGQNYHLMFVNCWAAASHAPEHYGDSFSPTIKHFAHRDHVRWKIRCEAGIWNHRQLDSVGVTPGKYGRINPVPGTPAGTKTVVRTKAASNDLFIRNQLSE